MNGETSQQIDENNQNGGKLQPSNIMGLFKIIRAEIHRP